MMYISAYPIAITIRNSNEYEERSLGIFSDDPFYDSMQKYEDTIANPWNWFRHKHITKSLRQQSRWYFVRQQLRAQLSHDLWWLVLAVFLVMVVEGASFEANPIEFSVFNVIFEVVSGKSKQVFCRTISE
jgi:Trk-type K+ transport system membrane component